MIINWDHRIDWTPTPGMIVCFFGILAAVALFFIFMEKVYLPMQEKRAARWRNFINGKSDHW